MDSKPFWASRTVWANAIGAVVAALTAFGLPVCSPELTPDQTCLPLNEAQQAQLVGGIMVLSNALNVVLRIITTKPVTARKEKSQ